MRWVWIAVFWLGFGAFDAMQTVLVMHAEGMHHEWIRLFIITTVSWLPWAIATPLALRLERRFPLRARVSLVNWPTHVVACIAVGFLFALWKTLLEAVFNPYGDTTHNPFVASGLNTFASGMLSSFVLYGGILIVNYGLDSRARLAVSHMESARLAQGLSEAQLQALRRQIEPHFLFNTLNTVSGLVRDGRSDAAITTVAALSDVLRRMLEDTNRQTVSLGEEMTFVRDYLHIAKVRFADRLDVQIDVPADLDDVPVPNLILVPLVENAIKHGIAKCVRGGCVRITAAASDGSLTLSVSNDGPSVALPSEPIGLGIGVLNVRSRLQRLYGNAASLTISNRSAGGVDVSIVLPISTSAALAT